MADQEKLQQQLGEIGLRYLKRTLVEISVLRELLQKLRAGDATAQKDIEHLSHKIHGSGAMFGFDELSSHAREIELAAAQVASPELPEQLDRHIAALANAAAATAKERGV